MSIHPSDSEQKNLELIKRLKEENYRLRQLACRDGLTNLYNKTYFDADLEKRCQFAASQLQAELSILMLDVDNFKAYNDRYGHPKGNRLLKKLSRQLEDTAQRYGQHGTLVARYGGEEFVIVLPDTGPDDAAYVAEHFRKAAETIKCPVSIGVASFGIDGITPESLEKAADDRLLRAKRLGRNRVERHMSRKQAQSRGYASRDKTQFHQSFNAPVENLTINNQCQQTNQSHVGETNYLHSINRKIEKLIKLLDRSNPSATMPEQTAYLSAMIPPTRRQRLIGAVESASSAALEEIPYGPVLKALVNGWQNPDSWAT
ncbi:MAG: GGDEF domain-containing protein [Cyanobacteria bacterium J06648_16]